MPAAARKKSVSIDIGATPRNVAPIDMFEIAPENPRYHRDVERLDEMSASLRTRGQLTPVIVYSEGGKLWITAGRRRFVGLVEIGAQSVWYNALLKGEAIAAGLAEQRERENLHPADEAVAWKRELDSGKAAVELANEHGVTERFVQQRVRLADLHPPILQAFADNKLNLEQAAAWANASEERQADLWSEHKGRASRMGSGAIKELIDKADLAETDRLVKFIGIKAYNDAGGGVRQELFAFDDKGEVSDKAKAVGHLDRKLVNKLANAKVKEAKAKLAAEGWGFVEGSAGSVHGHPWKFETGKACKTKADRANAGVYVSVDRYGKLRIERNLVLRTNGGSATPNPADVRKRENEQAAREAHKRAVEIASQVVARGFFGKPHVALSYVLATLAAEVLQDAELRRAGPHLGDIYSDSGEITLHGLSSDVSWRRMVDSWIHDLARNKADLVGYIAELGDAARDELLALLVAHIVRLDEYSPKSIDKPARRQLAELGRMLGVKASAHATPETEAILGSPLVRELCGETIAKPKAPAKPKAKPAKKAARAKADA